MTGGFGCTDLTNDIMRLQSLVQVIGLLAWALIVGVSGQHAPRPLLNKDGDWATQQTYGRNGIKSGPQESDRVYIHNSKLEATQNNGATAQMSVGSAGNIETSSRDRKAMIYENLASSRQRLEKNQVHRTSHRSSNTPSQQQKQRTQGSAQSTRSQRSRQREAATPAYMSAGRGRK